MKVKEAWSDQIKNGSDPNDPSDGGNPPEEGVEEVFFRIGDPSGSHSENWMITVTGVGLDPDKRMLRVKGRDFGVMSDSQMHKLRVGKQYEITIDHLGTDPEFLAENESPDYDWEATIDNLPAGVAESGSNSENEIFVVGGGKWIVDNREAVLTKEKHGDDENLTLGGRSFLLPVDLDIVHPATGELEEVKQNDQTKGGYIAVRRDDETPVTKLVIRKGSAVDGMKYRLNFNAGANFKIWKDKARTQAVTSEQTEFEPDEETTLFFEGLKKSHSIGQHDITLQAVINGESHDAETVYASIVEAEFDVWINIFIPVQWVDYPLIHPIHNEIITTPTGQITIITKRKIAGGDDRGFTNGFFENPEEAVDAIEDGTASRVHTQVTIIPFKELDEDGVKGNSQKSFIGETFNYRKRGSVPDPGAGYSATNRLLPNPVVTRTAKAGTNKIDKVSDSLERYGLDNNGIRFKFEGSADNPIVNPSPAIDWDFQLAISVNNQNVLAPKWLLLGTKQDAFPAYEIYVRDSDGDQGDNLGMTMYRYDPIPLGRIPGDLAPAGTPIDILPPRLAVDETVFFDTGDIP